MTSFMAARTEAASGVPVPEVLDLRQLSATDIHALLAEELEEWRDTLDWDFAKSAELVERFVGLHALNGHALVLGSETLGYSYDVFEDHKGLIGDLYVRRFARTAENEERLLASVLDSLMAARVDRIESQLMMVDHLRERGRRTDPHQAGYERNFMMLDLAAWSPGPGRLRRRIFVERWSEQYQENAAQLIASAYAGHVDSEINDQYRSPAGARRFLFNIVQYPGCGTFYGPASFAAFEASSGRLCGVSMASLVGPRCGHITQVCVAPALRGAGVGYELLRQSLGALRNAGCARTSLTVTASNADAVALYERIGFRTIRRFSASVWEGF
jgi:ribosomal protein S18 acetylase RimI-like enzyme